MATDNGMPELDDIQKKYFTKSQVEGEMFLIFARSLMASLFTTFRHQCKAHIEPREPRAGRPVPGDAGRPRRRALRAGTNCIK